MRISIRSGGNVRPYERYSEDMSTEWHFDISPDELNLEKNGPKKPPEKGDPETEAGGQWEKTGIEGQEGTLDSYCRQILNIVQPSLLNLVEGEAAETDGEDNLGFSPWIESILRSDENKYTENPHLRTLVLNTIALRLKIQDDIEAAREDPEGGQKKLEEDLEIASKTINDLQNLIHLANQVHDAEMSKEILKLKFSLYLHQTMVYNHINKGEEKGGDNGQKKGKSVRKGRPQGKERMHARPGPAKGRRRPETRTRTAGEGEAQSFLQSLRRVGFVPVLLFLTIAFLGILRYTGRQTPADGENARLNAKSPYHGELEFLTARCDDKAFYGTVTVSWVQISLGEKAEALQKLRTKLLKDGIQKGVLTDRENRRVASWDLDTISIHN